MAIKGFSQREKLIGMLIQRDGDTCHYCGVNLVTSPQGEWLNNGRSIDHIDPQIKGGTDDLDNLVLCCRACNLEKKHTKHYQEMKMKYDTDNVLRFLMGENHE